MKACSKCHQDKPETDYYTYTDNRKGDARTRLMAKCKTCHASVATAWKKRNPEKAREIDRRHNPNRNRRRARAKIYGLHEMELAGMEAAQQGICLICRQFSEESLVIDHDHATGQVRGLLCKQCNLGLGYFADDPMRLLNAIRYLKASNHELPRPADTARPHRQPENTPR